MTAFCFLSALACLLGWVAPDAEMDAVVIRDFGAPDVMKVERIARPSPAEGELLVRVHAAAVNPVDWKIRNGGARGLAKLPYTPGFDISGDVVGVGAGVTAFKPGDTVFAMLDLRRGGGYAEFAIVKASEAAPKPGNITHVESAALPLVALTAWQALFDAAGLEKGQTILIHGGAGGVGSVAVQLAHWKGARVIATASANNHAFLKEIGADEAIDYRSQKFEEIVKDVDVVLDTIGGDTQQRSWGVLKKGGILVSIVGGPVQQKSAEFGVRGKGILVRPDAKQLARIGNLVRDGSLKPVVSSTLPLSEAAAAHAQSESGHTRGKIVLLVMMASPADPSQRKP